MCRQPQKRAVGAYCRADSIFITLFKNNLHFRDRGHRLAAIRLRTSKHSFNSTNLEKNLIRFQITLDLQTKDLVIYNITLSKLLLRETCDYKKRKKNTQLVQNIPAWCSDLKCVWSVCGTPVISWWGMLKLQSTLSYHPQGLRNKFWT